MQPSLGSLNWLTPYPYSQLTTDFLPGDRSSTSIVVYKLSSNILKVLQVFLFRLVLFLAGTFAEGTTIMWAKALPAGHQWGCIVRAFLWARTGRKKGLRRPGWCDGCCLENWNMVSRAWTAKTCRMYVHLLMWWTSPRSIIEPQRRVLVPFLSWFWLRVDVQLLKRCLVESSWLCTIFQAIHKAQGHKVRKSKKGKVLSLLERC